MPIGKLDDLDYRPADHHEHAGVHNVDDGRDDDEHRGLDDFDDDSKRTGRLSSTICELLSWTGLSSLEPKFISTAAARWRVAADPSAMTGRSLPDRWEAERSLFRLTLQPQT